MLPDDLPEDMPSFVARFGSDEQCREYLFEARWPDGFRCSACGHDDAYALRTKIVYECVACRKQHSLLAGTIFEQTKTGLAKWFLAIYLVTSSKGGIAATELKRQLGLGSYQTAWTWLHKLRKAMVRPDRQPLAGRVEADETTSAARGPASAAGAPPARPWSAGRSRPAAARPAGAVSAGSGSPRWPTPRPRAWTPSSPPTSPSRRPWPPTAGAVPRPAGRGLRPRAGQLSASRGDAALRLPGIHLVFSLVKRWLLGTHHGAVGEKHLPAYLDEYAFRLYGASGVSSEDRHRTSSQVYCSRRQRPARGSMHDVPRGARPLARITAPRACIRWTRRGPDHDAAMRIGGGAPGRRAHSSTRLGSHRNARVTATSDRHQRPARRPVGGSRNRLRGPASTGPSRRRA